MKYLVFILFLTIAYPSHALPIIPGEVGPGIETPAGSGPSRVGGKTIHVTNLNDSGPGSLREAVQNTAGPRIVVPSVSGCVDITVGGQINVTNPYLTIAGQTAPSPGLSICGNGLSIRTHDVLVQHIRIRVGDDPAGEVGDNRDGIEILATDESSVYNVIIDHVSVSWAIDENMSIGKWPENTASEIRDISILNSFITEGLHDSIHSNGPHSMGFLMSARAENIFLHKNLFAHNDGRNPFLGYDTDTVFTNNVIYNWGGEATVFNGVPDKKPFNSSVVGNVYKRGADTNLTWGAMPVRIMSNAPGGSSVFLRNNELEWTIPQDQWASIVSNNSTNDFEVGSSPVWVDDLIILPADNVLADVLANSGAWPADRDAVDIRVSSDAVAITGNVIDSQDDVGGWPALAENVAVAQVPANPWEIQPSGYNRVEEWLHAQASLVEN